MSMGTTVLAVADAGCAASAGAGAAVDGRIGARNRVMLVAMMNFIFVNGAGLSLWMIGISSRMEEGIGD